MSQSHRTSNIWNHFSDFGDSRVKCGHCSKILSVKNRCSANMSRHIRLKHKGIHVQLDYAERSPNDRYKMLSNGNVTSKKVLTIPKQKRSVIWNHFSKVESRIVCDYCSATISSKKGSTSNLIRHLRLKHKETPISQGNPSASEYENLEKPSFNSTNELEDLCPTISHKRINRKNSNIWNHFSDIGYSRAMCCYCSKILSTKSGNTGNLARHMRHLHKGIPIFDDLHSSPSSQSDTYLPEVFEKETSPTIPFEALMKTDSSQSITHHLPSINDCNPLRMNHSDIDQQILKMIVEGYHPFSIAEGREFKKLVNILCPEYKIPNPNTISNNILQAKFNSTKELIENKLSDSDSICITIDNWTSVNNEIFITTTANWINSKTEFCSSLLDCINLNENNFSKTLEEELQISFKIWGISHKIVAVVSDIKVAYAIKQACWPYLLCFARNLNAIVPEGLVAIENLIKKIRLVINFLKSDAHAQGILMEAQENKTLPFFKLKLDIPSCWNSTYKMLMQILHIKDEINWIFNTIEHEAQIELTYDEWEIAEVVVSALKIFNEIALEISVEKNIPLSKAMLFIQAMKRYLKKIQERELPKGGNLMLEILLNQIDLKFRDCELNELSAESILLDPRFKKFGLTNEDQYNALRAKVSLAKVETDVNNSQQNISDCESTSFLWKEFDEKVKKHLEKFDTNQESLCELDEYMKEPLISRMSDPLIWWEKRKLIYPRLYKIACKRLCIVATSVPGERIFSKMGQRLNENRNWLTTSKINEIVFLHNNIDDNE